MVFETILIIVFFCIINFVLCVEIVKGLVEQMELDKRLVRGNMGSIAAFDGEGNDVKQYWDDLSGKRRNPELVRKAREEEQ